MCSFLTSLRLKLEPSEIKLFISLCEAHTQSPISHCKHKANAQHVTDIDSIRGIRLAHV